MGLLYCDMIGWQCDDGMGLETKGSDCPFLPLDRFAA
jgi:hypothetical protein